MVIDCILRGLAKIFSSTYQQLAHKSAPIYHSLAHKQQHQQVVQEQCQSRVKRKKTNLYIFTDRPEMIYSIPEEHNEISCNIFPNSTLKTFRLIKGIFWCLKAFHQYSREFQCQLSSTISLTAAEVPLEKSPHTCCCVCPGNQQSEGK